MTKLINSAYTKVEIKKEDYDKLVELAEMNSKQIEEKALEYWREKGASKLTISCGFKTNSEYDDDIRTEFVLDPWSISTGSSYDSPSKFELSPKMQNRIRKVAKTIVSDAFFYSYGKHLMEIDNIRKMKRKLDEKYKNFKCLTIIGWTLFLITFVITVVFV